MELRGEADLEVPDALLLAVLGQLEAQAGSVVIVVTGHNIDDALVERALSDPDGFADWQS